MDFRNRVEMIFYLLGLFLVRYPRAAILFVAVIVVGCRLVYFLYVHAPRVDWLRARSRSRRFRVSINIIDVYTTVGLLCTACTHKLCTQYACQQLQQAIANLIILWASSYHHS